MSASASTCPEVYPQHRIDDPIRSPRTIAESRASVPGLYPEVRPGARYFHSLRLLQRVKELDLWMITKSGIMVGLGEDRQSVLQVMNDMRSASVDFITVGQYLQPTSRHHAVAAYVSPEEFATYERSAWGKVFLMGSATPLRSRKLWPRAVVSGFTTTGVAEI